ncbi:MAG TPA: 2-hydroxyacid dehydrogenase, partial [Candidatus Omnitrophota bacterium]|nr:2-hydroxyacid dehydrogenase [Candidatus Omnitrophota bacterium]
MADTIKIAFFDAKPYDIESFESVFTDPRFKITFYKNHLTPDTVSLTQGFQVACVFINDIVNKAVIDALEKNGIGLIAVRAAGYNNIDLKEVYKKIHVV